MFDQAETSPVATVALPPTVKRTQPVSTAPVQLPREPTGATPNPKPEIVIDSELLAPSLKPEPNVAEVAFGLTQVCVAVAQVLAAEAKVTGAPVFVTVPPETTSALAAI